MRCAIKGVLLTGAMLVSAASQAYVISVTNASFEDTSGTYVTDAVNGNYTLTAPLGWTSVTGGAPEGSWAPKPGIASVPDGSQIAYVNSAAGVGSAIWQTTSETIQAGYTYTLGVSVGSRYGTSVPFDGAKISLLGVSGSTLTLLTSLSMPTLPNGIWVPLQLDFTATGAHAGQLLQVRLEGMGKGSQTNFDDVSLTAVPLPAAAWLFGSALLGLGLAKRRAARGDVPA